MIFIMLIYRFCSNRWRAYCYAFSLSYLCTMLLGAPFHIFDVLSSQEKEYQDRSYQVQSNLGAFAHAVPAPSFPPPRGAHDQPLLVHRFQFKGHRLRAAFPGNSKLYPVTLPLLSCSISLRAPTSNSNYLVYL